MNVHEAGNINIDCPGIQDAVAMLQRRSERQIIHVLSVARMMKQR